MPNPQLRGTVPVQNRTVDPFSDYRFSSAINKFSRIITGGEDVILNEEYSFPLTLSSWRHVTIGPGICFKDDVFIHMTDSFDIDFDDNAFYVDDHGAMISEGYYYILLAYKYRRSMEFQKANIKIMRDNIHARYTNQRKAYIFLGTAKVAYNNVTGRNEVVAVYNYDPLDRGGYRPVPTMMNFVLDAGEIREDEDSGGSDGNNNGS